MATTTEWRDRASGFFALSSMKLRNATQTAGIFVGDVANEAGFGVAQVTELAVEVAQRAGVAMGTRWSLLQQTRKAAAASTTVLLKRNLQDTKEKVAEGRTRIGQVAKRAAQRSRIMFERWQKGQNAASVFGVPLETLVQRQRGSRAVPQIVINCVSYLTANGLNAQNVFKSSGDHQVVQYLRYLFEEDWNTVIPEGTSPLDVAALLKRYLQMLPEPLLTYSVYNEIKEARGNVQHLGALLRTIPYAHYSTLECITLLLFRISEKSTVNKMDAHNLAFELAPYLLWKQTAGIHSDYQPHFLHEGMPMGGSRVHNSNIRDVDSVIPLDDEPMMADFAIIEAVQCLIEQQRVIFADPTEALWHESGE